MFDKIIFIWLKEKIQISIWAIILLLITGTWSLKPNYLLALQATCKLETPILAKITITLFFIALGLIFLLIIYHRKPKIKDYDQINPPGFLKHKKKGKYYCQSCLVSKHIISELSVITKKEFQCRVCKESYKIDYETMINDSYLSICKNNDPLFGTHARAVNELILKND